MGSERGSSGGFGWGLLIGGALGVVAGAYLATGPGREQVDSLRSHTVELTGKGGELSDELKDRARAAADRARDVLQDSENPVGRAVQEGLAAARRRRRELEAEEPPTPTEGV